MTRADVSDGDLAQFMAALGGRRDGRVRGAAFVREERRGNPAVVEALPAVEDLLAAGGFGLVHAEEDLDDFYLVVLERA